MNVSEYIFDFLQKKGCRTVHMVSGSSAMFLTDALKRNTKISPVCCQHEQAAAMAADAVGRLAGVPGVALVTIGPGATNAITGVAGAYVDSSPVIVLSGQASSPICRYQQETEIRQKGTQSIRLDKMTADITKYFALIYDPAETRYHIERAYYEAMHGRKGPVWLDIPVDVQNKQVPDEMDGFVPPAEACDDIPITEIRALLEQAERPLILAGQGVLLSGTKEALLHLAETQKIPIVTSRDGIGVVHTDHPLFAGHPGSYGDRPSHFAIASCDLLLILGSRLSVSTVGYYPERFAMQAKKIMVDIDPAELARRDVPIDMAICADLKMFFATMEKVPLEKSSHRPWLEKIQRDREKYPVVLPSYGKEEGINSYFFTQELSQYVPEDAVIVVDTGSVCNVASQAYRLKKEQAWLISGGLSAMGFWAAAIGAAACRPRVVALVGDGSAQMNIQEFATLAYYQLPVKVIVYNNEGYMLIRHNQHNYMDDRFLGVGPDSGVPSVNFCRVADAYGLPSVCIREKEEIVDKLEAFFQIEGPAVCEVMVQKFGILAPRIASRVMSDGSLKAAEFEDLWPFLDAKEGGE